MHADQSELLRSVSDGRSNVCEAIEEIRFWCKIISFAFSFPFNIIIDAQDAEMKMRDVYTELQYEDPESVTPFQGRTDLSHRNYFAHVGKINLQINA